MNLVKYMKNFFFNIYMFLKIIIGNEHVHWEVLRSKILHSKVHGQTRIYGSHFLNNSSVGKGTYIAINSRIYNTNIGKFCSIGPNFISGWGIHPINGISTSPVFYSPNGQAGFTYSSENKVEENIPIHIGSDVFIGANVTVLDGVTIGDGAVIGAGAVVSKNIPPYAVAVGCPIKIIKYRFEKQVVEELLKYKWWNRDETTLRKVEEMFFNVEAFLESTKTTDQAAKKVNG
jgi:acetyltransferase-like isoleucine patch superfamily enzyme